MLSFLMSWLISPNCAIVISWSELSFFFRGNDYALFFFFMVKSRKVKDKPGKKEHHLWMKRDSAGSGQKALNLVRVVSLFMLGSDLRLLCISVIYHFLLWTWQISKVSNEKEAVYGALDKWTAWETEFPLIAATKALGILRKRRQWRHLIQVQNLYFLIYSNEA